MKHGKTGDPKIKNPNTTKGFKLYALTKVKESPKKNKEVAPAKELALDGKAPPDKQQFKHKKLQRQMSYGALLVLVLVIVSFVAWPILSDGATAAEDINFGSYRGQPINYAAEYGLFNNNLNGLLDRFGIDSTSSDYQRRNVFEQAFFATVSQYGRYFFLRERGNYVSDKEANTMIYNQFTQDGSLNRGAWNQLQNDPNRLKNAQNIMNYAAARNIWNDVYQSMDLIHDKELELLVPTLGDARKVSYLFYRISDFPEAEVEKFYNQNAQLFAKQFLRRIVVDSEEDRNNVATELAERGNFGELAQLYSSDVYAQSKGEYGYQFYYEVRDFLRDMPDISAELATEWADEIFVLQQGEHAGPYQLGQQWYFFQLKTAAEIQAEQAAKELEQAEEQAQKEQAEQPEAQQNGEETVDSTEQPGPEALEADGEAETEPKTGFASVAAVVRRYIENNEITLITNYLRKNLEELKAKAELVSSLAEVEQEGREVEASFGQAEEFFGFSYSSENSGSLYDPMDSVFTESGLAPALAKSKEFFEDIFSLQVGQLSPVMLFGTEDGGGDTEQQYIVFFRLDEARPSNASDFARHQSDGLENKKSLYNYYLNNLLTAGIELQFLNNRNLKQRFESAYSAWNSRLPQN